MSYSRRLVYILSGPLSFFCCYFLIPQNVFGGATANGAVGTVCWMSLWWLLGPVDLAVTAFIPIVLNAFIQMMDMSSMLSNYSSETIMLLLGASILTVSWEETGLDKRIAAKLLSLVGSNLRFQIVLWFLISALLSAVLPNAVVCAAIIPIAISMLRFVGITDISKSNKASLILVTIVYAAGVGGLATPLGGAMNLVTVNYIEKLTGSEFMYIDWVIKMLPVMVVLLLSNIAFMMLCCKKGDSVGANREFFIAEYRKLPPMSVEEKTVLALFFIATILSFSRQFYQQLLPGLKPAYSFILCAILSFLVTHKDGQQLMTWKLAQKKIVWELIYVFAGGLAAGALINATGVARAIGQHVAVLNATGGFITVLVILVFTIVMSDITSNTATAAVAVPIVIAVIHGMDLDPLPYIYITSVGFNLSYMLPTSIRAIPVGYGLSPRYLLKLGLPLTLLMIVILSLLCYLMLGSWL